MITRNSHCGLALIALLCLHGGAIAQEATPADPGRAAMTDAKADTKPAPAGELLAEVIEVKGTVERSAEAKTATASDAVKWMPVKQGEKLGGGTQIRTGLRAHLILQFGDDTVVMIKRSTLASISQFYREADTETIRLGLGYGAVRGGTTEGTVRSDFVVESTVATLAKRGTEGWELWVEPYSGRWRVSLAESGLVEALQALTGRRRLVRPSEYVTQENIAAMWIKQDIFNHTVQFYPAWSITEADSEWNLRNPDGYAVVGPGLGSEARAVAGRSGNPSISGTGAFVPQALLGTLLLSTLVTRPSSVVRPEGHFGTGPTFDVLVPEPQQDAYRRVGRPSSAVRGPLRGLGKYRRRR